ncbi:MAG: LPS assembly lipoprotein LptE [Myxococcaceae bacterium]
MKRAALALCVLVAGCGYRLVAPNSELPGGVRSVFVPVFDNRTADPQAALLFTEAAKDQLSRAGRLGGEASEATLQGSVLGISSGPFATSPQLGKQPAFRMTVTLSLNLVKNGASVGSTTVSTAEEFPSGADVLLTESNRAAALKRLADEAVREGLERLQSTP